MKPQRKNPVFPSLRLIGRKRNKSRPTLLYIEWTMSRRRSPTHPGHQNTENTDEPAGTSVAKRRPTYPQKKGIASARK